MKKIGLSWIILLSSTLFGCTGMETEAESEGEVGDAEQEILNGTVDAGHEEVVRVTPVSGFGPCTGTLIGASTVITAAHCIWDNELQQPHAQMRVLVPVRACAGCAVTYQWQIGQSVPPPQQFLVAGIDIAMIRLPAPTPYAARASVPGVEKLLVEIVGRPITIVGFGRPDAFTEQYDVKRWGANTIDSANNTYFYFTGIQGPDSGTCLGDSGGPAFAGGYKSKCILGVTKGESPAPVCVGTGSMFDTRLDRIPVAGWILQNAADPTITTCVPYN